MKNLSATAHGIEQYAARTGRHPFGCATELLNSVRGCATVVSIEEAREQGFDVARRFKGDTYRIWYDPKVNDSLLAIIASDGAIKTVLRKEMFGRQMHSNREKGAYYTYGYESPKRRKRLR